MASEVNVPGQKISGKNIKLILAGVLGLLFIVRIFNASGISAEYDELWSLGNYVKLPVAEIFRDVATPNNHVLNTLGMKLFASGEMSSFLPLRMPSLLSFLALGVLLIWGTGAFLKNRFLQIACFCVILMDGLILHYAEVARGYMMQSFFASGIFFSLLYVSGTQRTPRRNMLGYASYLLCCIGCCLSVSSGILYAAIFTFVWKSLFMDRKKSWQEIWKEEKLFFIAGTLFTLFVLLYYVGNFHAFARGRAQFGEAFTSAAGFLHYAWGILSESHLLYALILTVSGSLFLRGTPRKMALSGTLYTVLMLLSALVTKGGPVRIYIGLITPVWFCAFICMEGFLEKIGRRQKECSLVLALLLMGISVYSADSRRLHFADPDLGEAFDHIVKNVPQNLVVIYRPTDAYVIRGLFGNTARMDFAKRLEQPEGILLLHDPYVGGMRFPDFATKGLIPSEKAYSQSMAGHKLPVYYYPIRKMRAEEDLKGKIVFCFVRGPVEELRTKDNFLKKHFISINGFLNPVRGMMPYYLFAADGNELSSSELAFYEKQRNGLLDFRVLGK